MRRVSDRHNSPVLLLTPGQWEKRVEGFMGGNKLPNPEHLPCLAFLIVSGGSTRPEYAARFVYLNEAQALMDAALAVEGPATS